MHSRLPLQEAVASESCAPLISTVRNSSRRRTRLLGGQDAFLLNKAPSSRCRRAYVLPAVLYGHCFGTLASGTETVLLFPVIVGVLRLRSDDLLSLGMFYIGPACGSTRNF